MVDTGNDFTVDVLVIGAGAQGRYVADALAQTHSVCVLADPSVRSTALDTPGLIAAGYTGNDAVRMQAARRTAGYWRHRAEMAASPGVDTPTYVCVAEAEVPTATRLWREAGLGAARADLPYAFSGGRFTGTTTTFRVDSDVVVDAGDLVQSLTPRHVPFVEGTVVRFGVDGDSVIDHVEVETRRGSVSIAPRFTVLAAGPSNAHLLGAIARRFRDQSRRREAAVRARRSQVIVDHHVIGLRSAQLPLLAGTFGDLTVVAHQGAGSPDVVWLVTGCSALHGIAPGDTDLRFDPPVDSRKLAEIVTRLRTASPLVDQKPRDLQWSAYVTREAMHPAAASADPSVGTPLPARLDSFGLDGFLALWPSHLGYTMLVGDVVAERVASALGASAGRVDPRLLDVARAEPPVARSRWSSPSMLWHDWSTFSALHQLAHR